jgi:hypothetical protein
MRCFGASSSRKGVTLVELVLATGLAAVMMAALAAAFRAVHEGWRIGDRRSEVLQNGRVAIAEMTRVLRQLRRGSSVSGPADTSGYIEFYDKDGALMRFGRNVGSGYLEYGPPGGLSALAGPVSVLRFTCYDINGNQLSAPVDANQVRSVAVDLTVTDAEARANPIAFSSKVFVRTDITGLVINEIMYHPSDPDKTYEWIELYNAAGSVDLAGWRLTSLDNQGAPDALEGDDWFGSGATVVPAGGYAVITDTDTNIYHELLADPSFETRQMSGWNYSNGWTRVRDGDTQDGTGKAARVGAGWVYQDATLPGTAVSAFFSSWEKSPAPSGTRLVITVRNTSNGVLGTLYDGPMHNAWTRHTADLTPYIGGTRRIYFETGSTGTYWLDNASVAWSYVDKDAVRLRVGDNNVGGQLRNSSDTITLARGGQVVDAVTYQGSWGGYGNNKSLERVSCFGGSSAPSNWAEGPTNGTPGRVNGASAP